MSPVERDIVERLVKRLLDAGHELGVNDGEETTVKRSHDPQVIINALATTDYDRLIVYDFGSILLVWGNEEDLISDHTDDPELNALIDGI